jgi:uncharacterized protein (TIGR03437 family)
MKLRAPGLEPAFSTLIGGECQSVPASLELDADGNLTLAVDTLASGFPLRQPLIGSGGTALVVTLSADGSSLLHGTYLNSLGKPLVAAGPDNSLYVGLSHNADALLLKLEPEARAHVELNRVANAFSGISAAVAPGALMSLSGRNLGPENGVDLGLNPKQRLPLELAGTRVFFDGIPAPIHSTSATRLICVAPHALSTWTSVQVEFQGQRSNPVLMPVLSVKPGLLAKGFPDVSERPWDGSDGAIRNQDGTENSPANPAARGSRVTIYATGLGLPQSPPEPGTVAATDTITPDSGAYVPWISGVEGQSEAAGTIPGFVTAMHQIRVRAPGPPSAEPAERLGVYLDIRYPSRRTTAFRSNVVWLYVR